MASHACSCCHDAATILVPILQELARAKDAAVAAEDYDEAKRLKASIERLKVGGQQCTTIAMCCNIPRGVACCSIV
jgi:hypothetical protein